MFPTLLAVQLDLKGQAVQQQLPYVTAGEGGFGGFLSSILTAIMAIAALLVLIFLIWGAVDYINSSGEKGKIESSRNKMTGAVVGLILLSSVLVIFAFIQSMLGIEILRFSSNQVPTSSGAPVLPSGGGRL